MTKNEQNSPSTQDVAEQLLWIRQEVQTEPMHVLKLTYLSHGWMLGMHDKTLIDEPAEAWRYGPVVPSIYDRYKQFGGNPINAVPVDRSNKFTDLQLNLITDVADAYSAYTAWELSNITHKQGSPWDVIWHKNGFGAIIPNELIRDYYRQLAN